MLPALLPCRLLHRWHEARLRRRLAGWREALEAGQLGGSSTAPFAAALGRARARGHLRLAVLGGSITAGSCASRPERRWPDRLASWIQQHTGLPVRLCNAGLGATGSEIGALRLDRDVLASAPDLLIVEFAVNDLGSPHAPACLEGLLRRALAAPSPPALALLLLTTADGSSAHDEHLALARHYGLPAASWRAALAAPHEEARPEELWGDPVHPADLGHGLAAALLAGILRRGFASPGRPAREAGLPAALRDHAAREAGLPAALRSEVFARTSWTSGADWGTRGEGFSPGKTGHFGPSSVARVAGAWREGEVAGEAIGVVVSRRRGAAGRLLVAVDEAPAVIVECWQDPDWGGRPLWALGAEGLAPGPHRLRVEVLGERAAGSEGHEVTLEAVWGAGRAGR